MTFRSAFKEHFGEIMKKLIPILIAACFSQGCSTFESAIKELSSEQPKEKLVLPVEYNENQTTSDLKPNTHYEYTVKHGNEGRGGAALRYPGYIHVINEKTGKSDVFSEGAIDVRKMYESLPAPMIAPPQKSLKADSPKKEAESGQKNNSDIPDDLRRIFEKYCLGAEELTDAELTAFNEAGGTKAIPMDLAISCNHQK